MPRPIPVAASRFGLVFGAISGLFGVLLCQLGYVSAFVAWHCGATLSNGSQEEALLAA